MGPTPSGTIAAVAGAATRSGCPCSAAGPGDPAQVERSAIGFLVNHRAELERQATILEIPARAGRPRRRRARGDGGGDRRVPRPGRRDRGPARDAPRGPRPGRRAGRRGGRRAPTTTGAGPRPPGSRCRCRVPATAGPDRRCRRRRPAPWSLLGERPPTELERVATARVAGLLVLELAREEAVGRAIETARREPLPADGPPWVVLVARQAGGEPVDRRGAAAGAGSGRPASTRAAAARRSAATSGSLAPARRMALRGDVQSIELRAVVAAPPDDPEGDRSCAGRIAAFLGRLVAVSRGRSPSPRGRPAAEADARATMEAAERLAEPPPVARADRLPAYRLLGNLHNLPDGERQARALLEPLLRGRADVRRERLATLRAVLEQPGIAEAARRARRAPQHRRLPDPRDRGRDRLAPRRPGAPLPPRARRCRLVQDA